MVRLFFYQCVTRWWRWSQWVVLTPLESGKAGEGGGRRRGRQEKGRQEKGVAAEDRGMEMKKWSNEMDIREGVEEGREDLEGEREEG